MIRQLFNDYGIVFVLLILCILFSVLTLKKQIPTGDDAVSQVVNKITNQHDKTDMIIAVGAANKDSSALAEKSGEWLQSNGFSNIHTVIGIPRDLRNVFDQVNQNNQAVSAIIVSGDVSKWGVIQNINSDYPHWSNVSIISPRAFYFPDFLKSTNILAIVDRIVVIAIIAIGMTMVIITGGIDLSVGSLIALAAVIATLFMKYFGGLDASVWIVLFGFIFSCMSCAAIGALCGFIITKFKVAPFIITLSVMMIARGLAYHITGGFSIYQVPNSLTWLGQGAILGIPNTVLLLIFLYTSAHIFMTKTQLGRFIYAVGGNQQASHLSGIPVWFVIVFVYTISALMAGIGGCIQASQINTGTPNMGVMYELYVIAAVVVGGTSLAGGTGHIFGTLVGAFIISVIQNGMNLLGIKSYTQQIVLGIVILIAVLFDRTRLKST